MNDLPRRFERNYSIAGWGLVNDWPDIFKAGNMTPEPIEKKMPHKPYYDNEDINDPPAHIVKLMPRDGWQLASYRVPSGSHSYSTEAYHIMTGPDGQRRFFHMERRPGRHAHLSEHDALPSWVME